MIHPELFEDSPLTNNHDDVYQQVDASLLLGQVIEGRDYYVEGGAFVFTADYLRRRGYCCDNGCRHCVY
ncbi:MAG: hypothetical protein DMF69_17510 [Acidobacteria bacterium]|nr:MAG: hypothetical protein DMF69_17510 [Acidobacteriota bacterium]